MTGKMKGRMVIRMIHWGEFLLGMALVAGAGGRAFASAEVANFNWELPVGGVFEKVEASFDLSRSYDNPFDAHIVMVDAQIEGPGGIAYTLPCFWFVPTTWTVVAFENIAHFNPPRTIDARWCLRFSPQVAGDWHVRIRVTDLTGASVSEPFSVQVESSDASGFLRIDPHDPRRFRFDDGSPFVPVGLNVGWNQRSLAAYYDDFYGRMAANGINWTRYWMAPFARQALEWTFQDTRWWELYQGVGHYHQGAAALLDYIVNLADQSGIYLQLVLELHTMYSTRVNPLWDDNPYNAANGGWLAQAADFFTDVDAIVATKEKYRYIVARWGYATSVMAWELFNEAQFTDGSDTNVAQWHSELGAYLKSIDPYGRFVTTSTEEAQLLLLADDPSFDLLQEHLYRNPIVPELATRSKSMQALYPKPVMIGEFGSKQTDGGINYAAGHPDFWGDHVRQGIWIGSMNQTPAMFWFWREYIRPYDLFDQFLPLSRFWENEDPSSGPGALTAMDGVQTWDPVRDLFAVGLNNERVAYFYVYDRTNATEWRAPAEPIGGGSLMLEGLANGIWEVTFFDPKTGLAGMGPPVSVRDGSLELMLAPFDKDIAIKLTARETYAVWQRRVFDEADILAGRADPEDILREDGISNLAKFAFGIDDPFAPVSMKNILRWSGASGEGLVISLPAPAGDVIYELQGLTDFNSWETLAELVPGSDRTVSWVVAENELEASTIFRLKLSLLPQ
jgi:hypothetical protein